MHVTHRKRFVSRDLVALAARRPQELAALSEAHYHDQIESIADEVLAAGQRIVMLTGPSAAGKTTSAHKIADAIAARGHRSRTQQLLHVTCVRSRPTPELGSAACAVTADRAGHA